MPLGIVHLVAKTEENSGPVARLWLVFFSDDYHGYWWTSVLRPGFRHICAASWFADEERWVYFNPTGRGSVIEIASDEAFGPRFAQLIRDSTAILRVRSSYERSRHPATFFCVGAIKALLGIKSRALSPWWLHGHLLARGAEIVPRPGEDDFGISVRFTEGAARRPGYNGAAQGREGSRGSRQDPLDPRSIKTGNAAT